jgi:hypothetical protein
MGVGDGVGEGRGGAVEGRASSLMAPASQPERVRIGCWAGFWGDSAAAATQVLAEDIDYLVGDHLAEITMALLARAREKDPEAGYVPDVVATLTPLLGDLRARGVKVVTNGGGLNPAACADALRSAAASAGIPMCVAAVLGDDVAGHHAALREAGACDMFTGEPLPGTVLTMNAYLGARPIARALELGADIVVTGRCADSAVVLGPLLHEFGWSDGDHDLLSAGTLLGHLVECGPQGVGGLFTDWDTVPGWDDMGYPLLECRPDGTAIISKPDGTGGLVTPATVAEQLLYEIGDPGAYVMPDVVCDWRDVTLVQDGPDRVRVSGARGRAPTTTYKATTTSLDGYRVIATMLFVGADAPGRARRAGEAVLARTARLARTPFAATSVEVAGDEATGATVKVAARAATREPLDVLGRELASLALVAQGMTGFFAGRPKPAPVIALTHVLLDKAAVPVTVALDGDTHPVAIAPGVAQTPEPTLEIGTGRGPCGEELVTVPLKRIAHGRSGDKGNHANIGIRARRPELLDTVVDQVTPDRVADVFGAWVGGRVHRWSVPGIDAINLLLEDVLGGQGGTSSLRFDPQGKSYAAMLLTMPVAVPVRLLFEGELVSQTGEDMPPTG